MHRIIRIINVSPILVELVRARSIGIEPDRTALGFPHFTTVASRQKWRL